MQLFLKKYAEYIIVFLIFVSLCFYLTKGQKFDFHVYYDAAQKISAGHSPYLDSAGYSQLGENTFPYKYSPVVAYFFIPFTLFGFDVSVTIFNLLSIVALCFSLILAKKVIIPENADSSAYFGSWSVFLAFLFILKPVLSNIELGQINIFLLLGLLIIYYFDEEENNSAFIVKSLIFALLIVSKITPALFLIIPLLKKDLRFLLSVFAVCVILLLIPSISLGFNGNLEMIRQWFNNAFVPNAGLTPFWTNQSLLGMLERFLGDRRHDVYITVLSTRTVFMIFFITSLLLIAVSIYKIHKMNDRNFALAILSVLYTIISPLSFPHYFVFLLIPFFYLLNKKTYKELFLAYVVINFSNYEFLGPKFYELVHIYSIMLFGSIFIFIKLLIEKEDVRI